MTLRRNTPDAELKGLLLSKMREKAGKHMVTLKVGTYSDEFEWGEGMQTHVPNLIEKALAHLRPCVGAMARTAQDTLLNRSPFVLPEVCRHDPACAVRSGGPPHSPIHRSQVPAPFRPPSACVACAASAPMLRQVDAALPVLHQSGDLLKRAGIVG